MYKVIIGTGLAHCLKAPVRGGGAREFEEFFVGFLERAVG
jgi:hypothetical protein